MYLSKLVVDRFDRRIMRAISDIYRLHQFIMAGYSEHEKPDRVLYRIEPEVRGRNIPILVQSQVKPIWEKSAVKHEGIESIQMKEIAFRLGQGCVYRFRLRANPAVTREGKRYGLIRDEALIEWLRKREESIGASFTTILPIDEGYLTGIRRKGQRTDRVSIKAARFEGMLKVTNPTRLKETLVKGIGPAKAFGCGLLSIGRI